jgi:hypothetical protein
VKLSKLLSLILLLEERGKTAGRTQAPDVFENRCFAVPHFTVNTSNYSSYYTWHAVARLVEALRYKPAGRGFDSLGFFY